VDDDAMGGAGAAPIGKSDLGVMPIDLTDESDVADLALKVCHFLISATFGLLTALIFDMRLIALNLFAPIRRRQFLEAAKHGSADEMLKLLREGADIESKDEVRRVFACLLACLSAHSMRSAHVCAHFELGRHWMIVVFVH
jgi:hypothetical protein